AACTELLEAKKNGQLGECVMPEDSSPDFTADESEARLAYFTLPMALNYQRDSYKLWEAALKTWNDPETQRVFSVSWSAHADSQDLRERLMKHKIALQPNKHVDTWQRIARTVDQEFGTISALFTVSDFDFIQLRSRIQGKYKGGFPYLSGPKIFNYWSFIIQEYGGVLLKNSDQISIAPDTHIIKCSVRLGVITEEEAFSLTREGVSERWRGALEGSGMNPIEVHPALWFWSRGGFAYQLSIPISR
ncbi:hypothetical protein KGQ71_05105, partial [Patescibacteria group bacterium]|nr:hypothetical protein [Patescibacteria group bacterium]